MEIPRYHICNSSELLLLGTERLITSQGPGTAFAFALALVEKLTGEETARATAKPMLL